MRAIIPATVLCSACLPCAGAGATALGFFQDGEFLRPHPRSGTMLLIDSGERYGTWRVVGASGNVAWVNGAYTHHGFNFLAQGSGNAPTANAWVNLAGISQSATGIAHAPVQTVRGAAYNLSFWVGNLYDPHGVYGTASTVAVYQNSQFLGKFTNSQGKGSVNETWQYFSTSFVADANFTVVSFINGDPPGDLNCGIDSIDLTPAGAP
jgi:hypothetical protein